MTDERFVHYFKCLGCAEIRRVDDAEMYRFSCVCGMYASFSGAAIRSQEKLFEVISPFAVFRKTAAGITMEIVGKKVRPWLDGVRPVWERERQDY